MSQIRRAAKPHAQARFSSASQTRGALALVALAWTLVAPPRAGASERQRTLVLAQGRCEVPSLLRDTALLTSHLQAREDLDVIAESTFRETLGVLPEPKPSEIERQLGAVRSAFFQGHLNRAKRLAQELLTGVRQLPPGPQRWELNAQGEAARFLIFKARGQLREGIAAFRNILRIRPDYQLDEVFYSPATRMVFEQTRAQVAAAPKGELELRSDPPGATVYVEGMEMGVTPTTLSLLPGLYAVELAKGGRRSIAREVSVTESVSRLHVDLALEGAISRGRVPCLDVTDAQRRTLEAARKIGRLVGADDVVAVAIEQLPDGQELLSTTTVEVESGTRAREGAIRLGRARENSAGVAELAIFVATGLRGPQLVEDLDWNLEAQIARAEQASLRARPEHGWRRKRTWNRPVLWGLGGAAVAGLVSGAILSVKAESTTKAFNTAYAGAGPTVSQLPYLDALRDRARTQSKWSRIAFGASAAAATLGLATYAVGVPAAPEGTFLSIGPGSVTLAVPLR